MGTEDQILKGTNLITNTKKQRLKIQSRGWVFKNIILKKNRGKKAKVTISVTFMYMKFALKNRVFFAK